MGDTFRSYQIIIILAVLLPCLALPISSGISFIIISLLLWFINIQGNLRSHRWLIWVAWVYINCSLWQTCSNKNWWPTYFGIKFCKSHILFLFHADHDPPEIIIHYNDGYIITYLCNTTADHIFRSEWILNGSVVHNGTTFVHNGTHSSTTLNLTANVQDSMISCCFTYVGNDERLCSRTLIVQLYNPLTTITEPRTVTPPFTRMYTMYDQYKLFRLIH